jgi:hypothetical protein
VQGCYRADLEYYPRFENKKVYDFMLLATTVDLSGKVRGEV